ncbi:MAG TPA: hypothetical protein VFT72_15350 [Opitutaceae bacterium]|nr:hypothetical protein [Opitutaceae bacterium]
MRYRKSIYALGTTAIAIVAGATGFYLGAARQARPETASRDRYDNPAVQPAGANTDSGENLRPAVADFANVESRWRDLQQAPRAPRTERDKADFLAALAVRDHAKAMQLALAEPNLRARLALQNAVLRGWAKTEPQNANAYALSLRGDERIAAVAAVIAGSAGQPAQASNVAATACDRDPDRAFDYMSALIAELGEQGNFAAAARFVASRPDTPQRIEETGNAFSFWAEHRPTEAAAALENISDPALRDAAFRGLVVGWSHADPAALAEFALQLPSGESRSLAIANAVPRWVEHDPVTAATWLAQREPSADFDMGVAAVATVPSMVSDRPELALTLAQTITDSALRTNTVQKVIREWAGSDLAGATRFLAASTHLPAAERDQLLAELREPRG